MPLFSPVSPTACLSLQCQHQHPLSRWHLLLRDFWLCAKGVLLAMECSGIGNSNSASAVMTGMQWCCRRAIAAPLDGNRNAAKFCCCRCNLVAIVSPSRQPMAHPCLTPALHCHSPSMQVASRIFLSCCHLAAQLWAGFTHVASRTRGSVVWRRTRIVLHLHFTCDCSAPPHRLSLASCRAPPTLPHHKIIAQQ